MARNKATNKKAKAPQTAHARLSSIMRQIGKLEAKGTDPKSKSKYIAERVAAYRKKIEAKYVDPSEKVTTLKAEAKELADKIAKSLV